MMRQKKIIDIAGRTRKRIKPEVNSSHQCDRCCTYRCPETRKNETARKEFQALVNERLYACEDYSPGYQERLAQM